MPVFLCLLLEIKLIILKNCYSHTELLPSSHSWINLAKGLNENLAKIWSMTCVGCSLRLPLTKFILYHQSWICSSWREVARASSLEKLFYLVSLQFSILQTTECSSLQVNKTVPTNLKIDFFGKHHDIDPEYEVSESTSSEYCWLFTWPQQKQLLQTVSCSTKP